MQLSQARIALYGVLAALCMLVTVVHGESELSAYARGLRQKLALLKENRAATLGAKERLLSSDKLDDTAVIQSFSALGRTLATYVSIADDTSIETSINEVDAFLHSNWADMLETNRNEAFVAQDLVNSISSSQRTSESLITFMVKTLEGDLVKARMELEAYATNPNQDQANEAIAGAFTALEQALRNSENLSDEIVDVLLDIVEHTTKLDISLATLSNSFTAAAQAGSAQLSAATSKFRAEAYGACGSVCLVTAGPGGGGRGRVCASCYTTADNIVETLVSDLQKKWNDISASARTIANSFTGLRSDVEDFRKSAIEETQNFTPLRASLTSFANLVSVTKDIVDLLPNPVEFYAQQIDELIELSHKLLGTR